MTVINKYDLNEFSPEELQEIYINLYADKFESTKEHAREMFLSEFSETYDFHNYKNVEYAIERNAKLCGIN